MNLDAIMQTFIVESREQLEAMESALLLVEKSDAPAEIVNSIFRSAHTIKGSAGLFSLDAIVDFTHVVESVLDGVRAGRVAISRDLVVLLLACRDHIGALIEAAAGGQRDIDPALAARGAPLLERLRQYAPAGGRPAAEAEAVPLGGGGPSQTPQHWHISLRFGPNALLNGIEPLAVVRYLGTLGSITGLVTLYELMPSLARMDPESCYLGFEIGMDSQAGRDAIEEAFEFVHGHCRVRLLGPGSPPQAYARLVHQSREAAATIGAALVRCGSLPVEQLATLLSDSASLDAAAAAPAPAPAPPAAEGELAAAESAPMALAAGCARSVRVDADKLDHLVNLVGELIIATESASLVARRTQATELLEYTARLSELVSAVRDGTLELRMVKIGATFARFQRVVHDVAREMGKEIALEVSGEDAELDKTVVEKLVDPLTHLVRNAIDHGIEPAALRRERGKPAVGCVRLNAYHDSGNIVIEVSDDGGGLNRDAIRAKAIERGVIDPAMVLSDDDIYALIFEPGFSTAATVTTLSGRGVGMDVVKRNIIALRGSVEVRSVAGAGTTMTVRLPLTLAIIDGFLVSVGGSIFVIPLDLIEECVAFDGHIAGDCLTLRGQVLPFARLRELFGMGGTDPRRASVVVVRHGGRRVGLVVDALLGESQTVIKPLGRMFGELRCITGSSILGSGEVALILDVPSVVRLAAEHEVRRLAA